MIHSYKKQSLIVLISLIYIWSCDSITQHGNPIIEDEILANAEVVDQRLTFDTKVQLNIDVKKLKNLEYDVKMAHKNMKKWETMIRFCDKKGWEFVVITEEVLKKFGLI